MQGLGDAIAKVTDALGIPKCDGCKKRQEKLNSLVPFGYQLTKDEEAYLTEVFSWYNGLPIPLDKVPDIRRCEDIWLRLYNVKTGSCRSCGSTYQNNYMNKLKALL